MPTQKQIDDYVNVARHFPLEKGQLESMVILHFDIPDKEAKTMVKRSLKEGEE